MAAEEFPVEVGVIFEGQRIRKEEMQVEFGGPKIDRKFELVRVLPPEEVEDRKVETDGPDLPELKEGGSYRLGIFIKVAGEKLERDLESVLERRIHAYTNYIDGIMHLNQRYDIWIRIGKKQFKKGLNTLQWWGKALIRLFKSELPVIEKMQVIFITDQEKVSKMWEEAIKIYKARDIRTRTITDEEVDTFYGCILCESFAPAHVCIITPNRVSLCGAITWFDARAAAKVDPKGPNFAVPKGELIDPIRGEYTGANEVVQKRSMGQNQRFYLYSMFGYPHTSCGCFEAIAFYIPEVNGIGVVHRDFKGATVNGLPFSTMAPQASGGIQTEGFLGVGIEYFYSPKFFQADGGWNRIVWMPKALKERIKDAVPTHLYDKIATEEDVGNVEELKQFIVEKGHPLAKYVVVEAPAEEAAVEAPPTEAVPATVSTAVPETAVIPGLPAGNMKIVLNFEGVKLKAGRIIIRQKPSK